jgi:hypothetical protein
VLWPTVMGKQRPLTSCQRRGKPNRPVLAVLLDQRPRGQHCQAVWLAAGLASDGGPVCQQLVAPHSGVATAQVSDHQCAVGAHDQPARAHWGRLAQGRGVHQLAAGVVAHEAAVLLQNSVWHGRIADVGAGRQQHCRSLGLSGEDVALGGAGVGGGDGASHCSSGSQAAMEASCRQHSSAGVEMRHASSAPKRQVGHAQVATAQKAALHPTMPVEHLNV